MLRRKALKLDEKSFENPLFLSKFTELAAELCELYPNLQITEAYLSKIYYRLQLFMEIELGKDSKKPEGLTKLPNKLFQKDYKMNSPIYFIIRECIDTMIRLQWSDFCLSAESVRQDGLDLIRRLHTILAEKRLLSYPCVFFGKVPFELALDLRDIVMRHLGTISSTESDATHVIEWNEEIDGSMDDNSEDYMRMIDIRTDGAAQVHYWYYPDSYDDWVNSSNFDDSELSIEESCDNKLKKWKLSCRFVKDVDVFNEWGNEVDYEIDEPDSSTMDIDDGTSSIEMKPKANKRSKFKRRQSVTVKKDPILQEAVLVTDKMFPDAVPSSKSQKATIYDVAQETSLSTLSIQSISSSKRKQTESNTENNEPDAKYRRLSKPDGLTNIGIDKNAVSAMEILYLSELFLSPHKLSMNAYTKIRNQIITIYRQNPTVYLSATDCRQKLTEEVGSVLWIHEFLDYFGVINSEVKSECKPIPSLSTCLSYNPTIKEKLAVDANPSSTNDDVLLQAISKHGCDWNKVSSALTSSNIEMSPSQCLQRFASLADIESKKGNINMSTSDHQESAMDVDNSKDDSKLQLLTKDYLDARISALETKMTLFADIQSILYDDRERLEIERRDFVIQKAQLAVGAQPNKV